MSKPPDELDLQENSLNQAVIKENLEFVENLEISPAEVQQFLDLVVWGKQPEVEEMLKKNQGLALAVGTVTEPLVYPQRTFRSITGFQYALWALDWQMWDMIRKYLPIEAQREQAQGYKTGSWVEEHKECAGWTITQYIDALQTLKDNPKKLSWEEGDEFWVRQVGSCQRNAPKHVMQEYCQPNRLFNPSPCLSSGYILERKLPKLNFDWGYNWVLYHFAHDPRSASVHRWHITVSYNYDVIVDIPALKELHSTRIQQRDKLLLILGLEYINLGG
jgi:hypothetical protein